MIQFHRNSIHWKQRFYEFFSIYSSTWAVPFTDIPTPWLVNTFGVLRAKVFYFRFYLDWRLMKFKLGVSFYKLFITGLPSAKPFQSWSFHQKIKGQKGAVWILKRIKQILDFQCHGGEIDALKRLNSRTDNCPPTLKQLSICLEELPSLEVRKSWKSFWSNLSLCLKPVSRLGVFPWNIPEMTSASFGPQVTMPMSKHMVNLSKHTVNLKSCLAPDFCDFVFKYPLIPGRHSVQAHASTEHWFSS